jgi:hypothetical protein
MSCIIQIYTSVVQMIGQCVLGTSLAGLTQISSSLSSALHLQPTLLAARSNRR